ncbi:hypothetical protein Tco_0945829 [Tanacetum coccineum]
METLPGPKPTNGFGPNYPLIPTAVASVADFEALQDILKLVGLGLMNVEKDGGWRWRDVMEVELELPLSVCLVFSTCVV